MSEEHEYTHEVEQLKQEIERLRAQMIVDAEQLVKVGRECERLRAEITRWTVHTWQRFWRRHGAVYGSGSHRTCTCKACERLREVVSDVD